ncbi:hypothetical protein J3A83DRAFT_3810612 [Scleroderma citrinum]
MAGMMLIVIVDVSQQRLLHAYHRCCAYTCALLSVMVMVVLLKSRLPYVYAITMRVDGMVVMMVAAVVIIVVRVCVHVASDHRHHGCPFATVMVAVSTKSALQISRTKYIPTIRVFYKVRMLNLYYYVFQLKCLRSLVSNKLLFEALVV